MRINMEIYIIFFYFHNFSDGVGDGQLKACKEFELKQMRDTCASIDESYSPAFTFIVVQKRINTKIYAVNYKTSYLISIEIPSILMNVFTFVFSISG